MGSRSVGTPATEMAFFCTTEVLPPMGWTFDIRGRWSFLHGQLECWNAGDRDGFFAHYRSVAPNGLEIEYLGRPVVEGFSVLENMWEQQNSKFIVEVELSIIAANEAACHHRNVMRDGS